MRYFIGLLLFRAWLCSASALTPPPDTSSALISGEWAGNEERGSYCYLNLGANRRGVVFFDGGLGDWLGARVKSRNRQQTLQVEEFIPLPVSTQRRIMPLETFVLRSGFNHSVNLTWNAQSSGSHLQKIEATTRHLNRARNAIEELRQGENKR